MELETGLKRRTEKFCDEELDVLVEEILNPNNKMSRRVPNKVRRKAWRDMLRRVNSVARSRRTLLQLKKRWYDVKRQRGSNIKRLYNQVAVRLSGESGSEAGGDLCCNIKEEPLETPLQGIDPQFDSKLNGQLMACVPMLKLEDIVMHISRTPLYSLDLEDPSERDPSHLNYQTTQHNDVQESAGQAQVSAYGAQVSAYGAQVSAYGAQVSAYDAQVSTYDAQDSIYDAQDSACHSESPDSPSTSSIQDQPSPSALVAEMSAEIKRMNAACSAMLTNAAQIASTIKELTTVIGTLTYQRRHFGERMLESMENIAVIMKKRRKFE